MGARPDDGAERIAGVAAWGPDHLHHHLHLVQSPRAGAWQVLTGFTNEWAGAHRGGDQPVLSSLNAKSGRPVHHRDLSTTRHCSTRPISTPTPPGQASAEALAYSSPRDVPGAPPYKGAQYFDVIANMLGGYATERASPGRSRSRSHPARARKAPQFGRRLGGWAGSGRSADVRQPNSRYASGHHTGWTSRCRPAPRSSTNGR